MRTLLFLIKFIYIYVLFAYSRYYYVFFRVMTSSALQRSIYRNYLHITQKYHIVGMLQQIVLSRQHVTGREEWLDLPWWSMMMKFLKYVLVACSNLKAYLTHVQIILDNENKTVNMMNITRVENSKWLLLATLLTKYIAFSIPVYVYLLTPLFFIYILITNFTHHLPSMISPMNEN